MPAAPVRRVPALAVLVLAAFAVPAGASAAPVHKATSAKLPAKFQVRYHVHAAAADPDHDGLSNLSESRAHTDPHRADSDRDGVADGAEDRDGDGLLNAGEQRAGTDPGRRDSDGDGLPDGREDADHDGLKNLAEQQTANDPGDPDSDGDGVRDGAENAGRVVTFAGGTLTLRLAATGKTVTATVDGDSDVQCGDAGGDTAATDVDAGATDDSSADADPAAADEDTTADDDTSADDAPDADASRFVAHAADDGVDGADGADGADDANADDDPGADDTTPDPCIAQSLVPGAWVHESALATADDGTVTFDAVSLVAAAS